MLKNLEDQFQNHGFYIHWEYMKCVSMFQKQMSNGFSYVGIIVE